jgi:Holliday junction resolvase RusA-like endonuclease
MTISFTIPGPPRGWQRTGTNGKRRYDTKPNDNYKHKTVACYLAARKQPPNAVQYGSPIRLEVVAYMPRPKIHYKRDGSLKPTAPLHPLAKADWDNIGKLIGDALNGIAYADDKNIVDAHVLKLYELSPGKAAVFVQIEYLQQMTIADFHRAAAEMGSPR